MAEFLVDEDGRAPYGVDMRRPEQLYILSLAIIYKSVDSSAGFLRHVFATLILLAP